ncbi:hypothetical protein RA280_38895 [Cupriavidus sp. CV2]|uniref:hypothetical protein n=1 Tax=Cupriavidus ulmosensis TaxID=3065913 RepID=UPI00296AF327|nr:hypothetical protein [Cupriavidus sp. CV2]MDW3687601.1 hypothetical protein [Cupriavidus sp. CV2]
MPQTTPINKTTKVSTHLPDHVVDIGLDKIKLNVLAVNIDHDRIAFIEQRFGELKEHGAKARSGKGKAFKNRLSVQVAGEPVLIECSPNRDGYPYAFTAEFNPNPFLGKGEKAINRLATFFRTLFGHDAPRVLAQAVVSRLDVNVDFDINPLEGTLVSVKGKRGGANVMCDFDGSGTLATLYIGALGSDRRLCIYDKAAQTLKSEMKPEAGKILAALASPTDWSMAVHKLRERTSGPTHWRMEVRCLPKPARPVAQLGELASCFDGIALLHLPINRAPFKTSMGKLFVGLARHVGIPVALQSLDELDRRRFNLAISKLDQVEWWNADILRDYIAAAIDRLAPLFRPPARHLSVIQMGRLSSTRPLRVSEPAAKQVTVPSKRKVKRLV